MTTEQDGSRERSDFARVSGELHARIANGIYPVGSQLPPERVLVDELSVSRYTLRKVLQELRDERFIDSVQGRGNTVIRTTTVLSDSAEIAGSGVVPLRSVFDAAFAQPRVAVDVWTLTSQSLAAFVQTQIQRVLDGEVAPEEIGIRLMLPAEGFTMLYPAVSGDEGDPRPRQRLDRITSTYTTALSEALKVLHDRGLVPRVRLEIRELAQTPESKVYLLNGTDTLHGPYEMVEHPIRLDDGEVVSCYDALGMGTTFQHCARDADPQSRASRVVDDWRSWFNSRWNLVAKPSRRFTGLDLSPVTTGET